MEPPKITLVPPEPIGCDPTLNQHQLNHLGITQNQIGTTLTN